MRSGRAVPDDLFVKNDISEASPSEGSTAWARTFAAAYDPFLWAAELSGVRALRRDLLGAARGVTVEMGSGTGLNLPHSPNDLDELVPAEPDPPMHARLEKRLRHSHRH